MKAPHPSWPPAPMMPMSGEDSRDFFFGLSASFIARTRDKTMPARNKLWEQIRRCSRARDGQGERHGVGALRFWWQRRVHTSCRRSYREFHLAIDHALKSVASHTEVVVATRVSPASHEPSSIWYRSVTPSPPSPPPSSHIGPLQLSYSPNKPPYVQTDGSLEK